MKNTLMTRYKLIHEKVNYLYLTSNIKSYPIDPFKLVSMFKNVRIVSYSQFAKDFNVSKEYTIKIAKSKLGCCHYQISRDRHLILYNDDCLVKGRILWTIVHEIGHIVCDHYNTSYPPEFSDNEIYDFEEHEANFFTSQFLAHPSILRKLNIQNSSYIETYCDLSAQAARNRYTKYLSYDINHKDVSTDLYVINNFKEYLADKYEDYLIQKRFENSFFIYNAY